MRTRFVILLGWVAASWLTGAAPAAGAQTNSYQIIAERNAFRLRPAARVQTPQPVSTPPALRLTGVVRLEGKRWAFIVREHRGRPEEYLRLQEGQSAGDLEVREVDVEHGEVRLSTKGAEQLLSFAAQQVEVRAARQAEAQFVEEHTRAHEALQRLERVRLARETVHRPKGP